MASKPTAMVRVAISLRMLSVTALPIHCMYEYFVYFNAYAIEQIERAATPLQYKAALKTVPKLEFCRWFTRTSYIGVLLASAGCEVCRCKTLPDCDAMSCMVYCEHGRVIDDHGCETCECKPHPRSGRDCPPIVCKKYCPRGFEADENGCDICKCVQLCRTSISRSK